MLQKRIMKLNYAIKYVGDMERAVSFGSRIAKFKDSEGAECSVSGK